MKPQITERSYISVEQAEKLFKVSRDTLRKYRYERKIKETRSNASGRNWKYRVSELERLFGYRYVDQ